MKIADITVELIDNCGSDLNVVNAARVSFEKESQFDFGDDGWQIDLNKADQRLINYLAKHKHFSPFNHCFASFRVKAPIFVARQLVKHKFLPWNEVSRRYVDSEPEFFIPKEWRKRAENVKQGSSQEIFSFEGYKSKCSMPEKMTRQVTELSYGCYKGLLQQGVCPEQARMVLPQNTMTEWIWSGTLGAWADMCRLRLDPHAQYETRVVAEKISKYMQDVYPYSWEALVTNNKE